MRGRWTRGHGASLLIVLLLAGQPAFAAGDGKSSRLSDEPIPLAEIPSRPKPILELGEPFLGTGTLNQGFTIPGGAVWQPALMLFGTYRTSIQSFDTGGEDSDNMVEWANRFDLFANLYLTFTERVLVGFRPLDRDGGFTGYQIAPDASSGGVDRFNAELSTLFFEGDFGELFPNLDKDDSAGLDFGLSIGRQPVAFQEGMLINDTIDAFGITKANVKPPGLVNLRWSLLTAWNELDRLTDEGPVDDESAFLVGLFTEGDSRSRTMEFDVAYVGNSDLGDGVFLGASSISRKGSRNLALRAVASIATGDATPQMDDGVLLFGEMSWTPHGNHDLVYVNGFAGIESFRSIARGPGTGGPLGRAGILFVAPGLGRFGAPLGNRADDSVGAAIGYQKFMANTRQQILFEAAGRFATDDEINEHGAAVGARYQAAVGRRWVIVADGFVGLRDNPGDEDASATSGVRLELVTKL